MPETQRRNPFANLLPSLQPKTEAMMQAMLRAIHAPVAAADNLLNRRRQEITMRQAYRVRSSRRVRAKTNLSVHEKRTRRRIRNLNRGRGPT